MYALQKLIKKLSITIFLVPTVIIILKKQIKTTKRCLFKLYVYAF